MNIKLEWINANNYILLHDITRYAFVDDKEYIVTARKGLKTDLTSIPRLFWTVFPKDGDYLEAAIIHDYLYTTQEHSRYISDRIFLNLMKQDGIDFLTRNSFYNAVRLFGWLCYYKRKRR
jgi:hypothetical protein